MKHVTLLLSTLLLSACEDNRNAASTRFPADQLALGDLIFRENCEQCHGIKAGGIVREWQKRLADGTLPAPPLNGTAHAWHHNDKVLMFTVNQGGIPLGGTMPAFRDVLDEDEKIAVLAYIKNLWPEELYQAWLKRNG